jgi:uncharacterized membrane protein YqjE
MDESAASPPGLFASLKRLWRTLLAITENRLELLLVELEEERRRAVEAVLLAMALGVLALMTLIVGSLGVVVLFWDHHRVAALTILTLVYFLGACAAYWKLRRHLRNWTAFSASLAEFKKDKACLEGEE